MAAVLYHGLVRCMLCQDATPVSHEPPEANFAYRRVQAQGTCDAQSICLGISVMRLVSRGDERQAGLALVASIRERLSKPLGEVAPDDMRRVRLATFLTDAEEAAEVFIESCDIPSPGGQCSTCARSRYNILLRSCWPKSAVLCGTAFLLAAPIRGRVQRRSRAPRQVACLWS